MPRTLFTPAGAEKGSDSELPAEKLKNELGLIFHIFHFNWFYFGNIVDELKELILCLVQRSLSIGHARGENANDISDIHFGIAVNSER